MVKKLYSLPNIFIPRPGIAKLNTVKSETVHQVFISRSVVTQALLISYCSLPLKNQLLHRAGIQARALIYFYVLFTRAAIQTGPKSRSGGKTSIYGNTLF